MSSLRHEINKRFQRPPRVIDPEHRIKALLRRAKLDSRASDPDPLIDGVLRALAGDTRINPALADAFEVWLDDFKRGRLSAWLFAGADALCVERNLGIARPITEIYARIFFDVSVFADRLDKERYTQLALERVAANDDVWYHELIVQADRFGLRVLESMYSDKFNVEVAMSRVARDIFMEYLASSADDSESGVKQRREIAKMLLSTTRGIPTSDDTSGTAREHAALKLREDVEAERMAIAMASTSQPQIIH